MPPDTENSSKVSGAYVLRQRLACANCQHTWQEGILQNVLVEVWVSHVRSLRCPRCGADHHQLSFLSNLSQGAKEPGVQTTEES